ncbi:AIR synthase related protein domain protein [Thermogladius calderae 1633]|uniref:Thiamine-monophosphate kinase n=1 Tax=Thermogladius calderae (strain DSM 22663 / VKM B-2946 / 1633) TaxID=1184251 RepID=I3TFZ3_THEC1|nr:thiamine-phosphate kinase [Thermogladius calderae]AFK51681.1 AIR synthase related protein domain protein [Thermogladius calderae 1633]
MKLGELTERLFIEGVLRNYLGKRPPFSRLGFPDDAVDFLPLAPRIVVSVDASSIASVKLPWRSLGDAAWAIATGAVSDHIAKGSRPAYALVSLGLSPDLDLSEAKAIVRGLSEAFNYYGVSWVGGDTNSSRDPWISVTMIGFTTAKRPPPRSGARPGDAVVVTGRYGAMGYVALRGVEEASRTTWVVEKTRRPLVDVRVGTVIALNYKSIHASMDVSDGLGFTIMEISRLSGVGFRVEKPPLVFKEVYELCEGRLQCLYELSLNGGEEYGVVMTVSKEGLGNVVEDLESYGVEYEVIGEVVEGSGLKLEGVNKVAIYGWDQFGGYVKSA